MTRWREVTVRCSVFTKKQPPLLPAQKGPGRDAVIPIQFKFRRRLFSERDGRLRGKEVSSSGRSEIFLKDLPPREQGWYPCTNHWIRGDGPQGFLCLHSMTTCQRLDTIQCAKAAPRQEIALQVSLTCEMSLYTSWCWPIHQEEKQSALASVFSGHVLLALSSQEWFFQPNKSFQ